MKVLILIGLAILAQALAIPMLRRQNFQGHKVLGVKVASPSQAHILQSFQKTNLLELDFWKDVNKNGIQLVHVTPENEAQFTTLLRKHGMTYTIVNDDLQSLVDSEQLSNIAARNRNPKSIVGTYATIEEIDAFIRDTAANTAFASYESIGNSYEGNPIGLLKFSTGAGRKILFIDFNIHAREWITSASGIWMIDQLAAGYGSDADITQLLNTFDVYVIPMLNPDGYRYSYEASRFWRKTRTINAATGCYGADPNRNWGYPTFGGPGTSSNPCADTYHGDFARSEPCVRAITDYLTSIRNRLAIYIAVHNFSQYFMLNWGHTRVQPPGYDELKRVGRIGAQAMSDSSGLSYETESVSVLLGLASGGSFDWVKGELNTPYTYALELRPGPNAGFQGFIVDASEIPSSGAEVLAGVIAVSKAVNL